jgi:lipoprotein-releasing system permease protein
MIYVSFFSIMIGSCSLALILSIMHGFEQATYQTLQGIHAPITMSSAGSYLNARQIGSVLDQEFGNTIQAWSPIARYHGIVQRPGSDDITNVIAIQGVDPQKAARATTLEQKIVEPRAPGTTLTALTSNNQIIIGKTLANKLGLPIGSPITLLLADEQQSRRNKVSFSQHETHIGGLLKTGIEEFDTSVIVISLNFFNQLFPDIGITEISIQPKPKVHQETLINKLRERFGIDVYSWKELYPALVSAMKLERYAMFFIVLLIALVASMNIISLLFMHITQKRGDIAILKAMGMPHQSVRRLFLYFGLIITLLGSSIGLLLAFVLGLFLQHYHFIELPDVYYTTHLPIVMEPSTFALVFMVTVTLGIVATWIATRTTQAINIANVLRFEG